MSEYSKMTLEDAKNLLKRIKKEIYRRSGMDEEGNPLLDENLRHFNLPILDAPDDSLFDIGYTDDVIRALNGSPIINTLINIGDFKDLRTVNEYDPIPQAFDINEIESILTQLESEPYDSAYTSCRSACTGLCMNNCTSSCSGGCENSCSMCSSQCSGMCSTECTGCSVSCGTDCGVSCGTSCANDSSACTGCSSGCVSCTGCSETCTSSCTGCNTTCYTGCNGGVASYSSDANCNNSCSVNCGGKASSTPTKKTTYGIELYHDGQIYGISKTDLRGNGTFVLPEITISNMDPYRFNFSDNSEDIYWSDGWKYDESIDGWGAHMVFPSGIVENKFNPGDTVYFSKNESTYNKNVALGRKATMNTKLCSAVNVYWASCTKYHITSDIRSTTDILSNGDTYTLDQNALVHISATKYGTEIAGFNPKIWGVKINGNSIELPFTGVLSMGDNIEVYGAPSIIFKLKRTCMPRQTVDIKCPGELSVCDTRCWCTECSIEYDMEKSSMIVNVGERKACNIFDNEHVECHVLAQMIPNGQSVESIHMEVESHLILGSDGKYHGYIYEVETEYYSFPDKYAIESVYGMNKLMAKVRLLDTDEYTRIRDIDVTEYRNSDVNMSNGSYYDYQFTIPDDLDSDIIGFIGMKSNIDSNATVIYKPGNTYSLFVNQHIMLKAIRESDNNG